jgi:DNA-binding transcriptional MerR regulator
MLLRNLPLALERLMAFPAIGNGRDLGPRGFRSTASMIHPTLNYGIRQALLVGYDTPCHLVISGMPRHRFLTVSELAEACCPRNAEGEVDRDRLRLWIRRLRHWSQLGILPERAMRQIGAGQHRLYGADLVYLAAILLRASGTGISVGVIKEISKKLQRETQGKRSLAQFWRDAKRYAPTPGAFHYLLIWIADEGRVISLEGVVRQDDSWSSIHPTFDPESEPMIVLSLTNIFLEIQMEAGLR